MYLPSVTDAFLHVQYLMHPTWFVVVVVVVIVVVVVFDQVNLVDKVTNTYETWCLLLCWGGAPICTRHIMYKKRSFGLLCPQQCQGWLLLLAPLIRVVFCM